MKSNQIKNGHSQSSNWPRLQKWGHALYRWAEGS